MDLANSTRQAGLAGSGALAVLIGLFSGAHADAARLSPQTLVGSEALANLHGKTVLLAGATGNNGRVVLRQLAALGVKVRAMTRDAANARAKIGAQFEWVEADVTRPETLTAAMQGVNVVIDAVATMMPFGSNRSERVDYEGTINLARAAKAAGATRFVIITSSVSGKKDHFLNYIGGNVLIWKGRAEEELMKSGLEYVVVGPTAMTDDPGGVQPIQIFSRDKYQSGMRITREDVATVVIAAAALPDAANRTFSVANGIGPPMADWHRAFRNMPAK
jgi:uncharacterized protein YbjT (DUF2867 family)